jgi:hypothetical protein
MTNQIVFLFGAGASYGAGHIQPHCPPLMCGLYDELAEYDKVNWGQNSPLGPFRKRFIDDFETTYSQEVLKDPKDGSTPWNRTPPISTLLEVQKAFALYFSRFSVDTHRNDYYSRLLIHLTAGDLIQNCLFASLNYDCLFEKAAKQLSLSVDYMCDRGDSVRIAKLHGSCNFIAKLLEGHKKAIAAEYRVDPKIDILPTVNEDVLGRKFSSQDFVPVIAQFSPYKDHLVCPAQIEKIKNIWRSGLLKAGYLHIIGVSYNQNDYHIVQCIHDTGARISYIGDECNFRKWSTVNKKIEHIGETFEGGFQTLIYRLGDG